MWRICIETEIEHLWKPEDPPKTWWRRLFCSGNPEERLAILKKHPAGKKTYREPSLFESQDMALLALEIAQERIYESYLDMWIDDWDIIAEERVVHTYVEEV